MIVREEMTVREELLEESGAETLLFLDGFDHAIVGVGQKFNEHIVVYDKEEILATLRVRDDMSPEEALEFYDYNIVGDYMGDQTPIIMVFSLGGMELVQKYSCEVNL